MHKQKLLAVQIHSNMNLTILNNDVMNCCCKLHHKKMRVQFRYTMVVYCYVSLIGTHLISRGGADTLYFKQWKKMLDVVQLSVTLF